MKKIYTFIMVLSLAFLSLGQTNAVTSTPSATPKISPKITQESEVEKIKDLVASKVAELKLVDKRGLAGAVKTSSNSQIIIRDYKSDERMIEIDELTKFEAANEKSFGISDIKSGDSLSFVGLFNKDTKRLLARFVSKTQSIPENIEGIVALKDKDEFTVTIILENGDKKVISIESSTKTSLYEEGSTKKSGFSKIEIGQRIIAVGYKDPKISEQINASRIIHFAGLPPSSRMKKLAAVPEEEIPVSTGSGKKLTPIKKTND